MQLCLGSFLFKDLDQCVGINVILRLYRVFSAVSSSTFVSVFHNERDFFVKCRSIHSEKVWLEKVH